MKYFSSSSKPTIDDLKNEQRNVENKYKDVEDADYKEIPPEEDKEGNKK
ncbi:MAG: hypothetical protein HKM87_09290 [Ignavibacteriaceae bacterium]|nr:hypothetical protein [Ignavibacteriaceae bacterium]